MTVVSLAWFLTNFADQALIIPLSLVMAIGLWMSGWRRGAKGWLVAIIGTLCAVVVAKLGFYVIAGLLPFRLISPSSHVAAGALVYGILLALLVRGRQAGIRSALVSSSLFAICFAATRLELGAHSRAEVIVGSILGIMGTIAFVRLAGQMPESFNRLRLGFGAALVIFSLYGQRLNGELVIRSASYDIRTTLKTAYERFNPEK